MPVVDMPLEEINALKDCFVRQLAPLKIYLFGSYANGTYTAESDFDFYIIVEDSRTDLISLMRQAYRSIRGIKQHPVDILIGTQSKFDERKTHATLEHEVAQKGMLLYGL